MHLRVAIVIIGCGGVLQPARGEEPSGVVSPVITPRPTPAAGGIRLPCQCAHRQCGCCTGLILERFKQKACMNLTYDAEETSITASMSMNERVLYKNTLSGKNPQPMCVPVPRFRFIEFCVQFSNVYFAQRNVHMCIDAEANWDDFSLVEWSFDCVRLGAGGFAVIGPEEGGGLALGGGGGDDGDDIEDYDEDVRSAAPIAFKRDRVAIEKLPNGFVKINFNPHKL